MGGLLPIIFMLIWGGERNNFFRFFVNPDIGVYLPKDYIFKFLSGQKLYIITLVFVK